MNRIRALVLSLTVGVAAIAGLFALGHTLALGRQAQGVSDRQVARRTAQLNRYQASLQRALATRPPALPPLPKASAASRQSSAPVRVVYHRPPPVVVTVHRSGGEADHEGGGADD
jgi:hypothetical protein